MSHNESELGPDLDILFEDRKSDFIHELQSKWKTKAIQVYHKTKIQYAMVKKKIQ